MTNIIFFVLVIIFYILTPKYVFGQDQADTNSVINDQEYEMKVKANILRQKLLENGQLDDEYIKMLAKVDLLDAKVEERFNGYLLTTGKAGVVAGEIKKDVYLVDVPAIPGYDLKYPELVDAGKDGQITLNIGVKNGSGQVEKISAGITKTGESTGSAKIKAIVFGDQNSNGILDQGEQILPLARMKIKLTRTKEDKTISLLSGWNLITLPAVPQKPLTASGLIGQISRQGGDAATVSTLVDGAWKSYVIRGAQEYSLPTDDFVIEPGKAYFIKTLKPSRFTFTGQNFVEPVKLNLSSGWNAIGLPKTSKSYKAGDLTADTVASWDFGLWNTFVKKDLGYGDNFKILNNKGYILKVGQGGEFSP